MRDSRARQSGTQQQMQQTQAAAREQTDAQDVQVYAVPSAPIGGIETYSPSSTTEIPTRPVATMPIGNQARLAVDEQLSGACTGAVNDSKTAAERRRLQWCRFKS